jgi:adenylyl-sulfate kinase
MVIWLLGISGSGKTTLGTKVYEHFNSREIKSYMLDGDIIRDFYDNDLGFSKEDRVANIKRIMLAAFVLENNGIIPIVCNISPYQSLREMAQKKFHNYHEIYLMKDVEIARQNDIKGVYKNNLNGSNMIGLDMPFEEPLNSNLVISVDNESVDDSFQSIISYYEGVVNGK